ncbi:ActS/PrrB/RegB family redox-sensitive histidine kinase [Shimia thalassica]|uniref:sensor histidine kinase RegB n=1 Tax=Shimia thalassica TaxID=1715693 RepID=UPI000C0884EC|nr:ActS/PrrB/RegB family redox-sensitive histidine kinase [Shimia thalassica]PHO02054.1 two-component sensor histidine kinase [Rhodobacteraceae bacterium 4F10]MDO6481700.1 ActS/PrrB/RegB family redox-sensitive histidine kinase [Shimia thalassica]MDO6484825.1 ActS/PrrB/RegB family redox-sensitive histidine kinase [Shimia thalassica]MDO6523360.1 ActS/PrrB/RegB family redox-sensitive histidine kinase [Shimia thalassica]MDO6799877.1 ActS/PrrB/RegB family redox-sensitive histidine kinase [Shimia th
MSDFSAELLSGERRSNWIRLRTIIRVRWFAVAGQVIALMVAQWYFGLEQEYGLCYLAVGISVIGNLIAMFVFPENKLLSETENTFMILFDLLQLCFLLFLTGGLHNPFSVLLVGPITISASVLSVRSTVALASLAIVLVTVMLEFHLPLRTEQWFILRMPDVFLFGTWAAIVIAIVFSAVYSRKVVSEMSSMSEALAATQMALAREQKLTDLGGVVAAAAHELGTPLATIKLTSAELMEELEDDETLYEDAALIREQADRCRDILRDMGRAGKDDLHLRKAPLMTLIEEAAEPHMDRGKDVHLEIAASQVDDENAPLVLRKSEIIHGLRNLIQNAVDFSRENVWVEAGWDENTITLRIMDDGRGYPLHLIGRIGDPFVRRRRSERDRKQRPGYEGMGLGLFIAKTLLERSGAELSFANGSENPAATAAGTKASGAIVEVVWPRDTVDANSEKNAIPIGENPRFSQLP